MKRKKELIVGAVTIAVFALFIFIMQNNFQTNEDAVADEGKEKETYVEEESEQKEKSEEEKLLSEKETKPETENVKEDSSKRAKEDEVELEQKDKDDTDNNNDDDDKTVSFSKKYVNVSTLNVRSGPGIEHSVVGVVSVNDEIDAAEESHSNGWVQISTNNLKGYVNAKYLSTEKSVVKKPAPTKEKKEEDSEKKEIVSKETNKENKKEEKKDSTSEQKETPPKNDAEKLTTVDGNNQLILVTTNGYGTSSAKVQTFERDSSGNWTQVLNVNGYIGKNGFADNKVEGDGKSPTGKYSIGTAFGRSGNPGTKLSYRAISADDVWVDDSNSKLYNTWQSKEETSDQWDSAENMDIDLYTYGFVINYNTAQTPGKGSAIFFHIANGHTLGCTGVSQQNVVSILKWLDPSKNPVIIQTPESGLSNY
ncbi:SH3 domain-containing protein [Oceanobacillus halophilus]|uniref:SH3b domain-containing protein n=1 Tax=Oceanobacillus halophilus TaxID=930130 RepID=A0A495A6S8_9BACI|nr:SH3 domain-containing protein [Oceanobacillus halophilus]RKQ35498.1 hypothetical protein D8M06_04250 [Oceanobacillus halophilus]